MLSQPISVSFDLGGDRQVSIGTGQLARQADVLLQCVRVIV